MAVLSVTISALLAVILGIAILVFPKILRWAVGLYFLLFGIIQLAGQYFPQFSP